MSQTSPTPDAMTEVTDAIVEAARSAVSASLVPGIEAHLDALSVAFAQQNGVDVEIARVLLAAQLADASAAVRQVAVGRAVSRGRTMKNIAAVSGATYASALFAKFPHARSVAETYRGVESSKTARQVVIDGWKFALRPRQAS